MSFPLNWKCWNWKWWKEWTCGRVLLGIMPFFQKTLRSRWWNFALYVYIFGEVGDIVGASKTRSSGNFFHLYLDRFRQNFLCARPQLNDCQINLWITLDKILSIVFLCFLLSMIAKMVGANKNLKLKWFHKFRTLDDLIKKLQTNLDFYI